MYGLYTILVYHVLDPKLCFLTVTSMDGFSKTIPAVCWLTLNCPGAMDTAMDNNLTCIMVSIICMCKK